MNCATRSSCASPDDGNLLVLRIGPCVGKVQIQNQHRAGGLDAFCQGDGVLQRVVWRVSYRPYKDANAEGSPGAMLQDGQLVAGFAIFLISGQLPSAWRIQRGDIGA